MARRRNRTVYLLTLYLRRRSINRELHGNSRRSVIEGGVSMVRLICQLSIRKVRPNNVLSGVQFTKERSSIIKGNGLLTLLARLVITVLVLRNVSTMEAQYRALSSGTTTAINATRSRRQLNTRNEVNVINVRSRRSALSEFRVLQFRRVTQCLRNVGNDSHERAMNVISRQVTLIIVTSNVQRISNMNNVHLR